MQLPFPLRSEQFTFPFLHAAYFLSFSAVLFPRLGSEFKMYVVTSHPLLLDSGGIGEKEFPVSLTWKLVT